MFGGIQIGFNDVVQVMILYVGIYALIRYVRGTRNAQVLLGFCVFVVSLLLCTYLFRFDVLARVVYYLLIFLAVSMVVVFQQEIRRMLALVGGQRLFDRRSEQRENTASEELLESVIRLAHGQIGALIAIERGISLRNYEESGVKLNALISHELLLSVFTPPLPLHDGGIVLRNGRVSSAHCLFPLSNRADLIASGMRHRAAVGLSEETDALVLVVSEETGKISVAHNGRLHRYNNEKIEKKALLRCIKRAMPHEAREPDTLSGLLLSRVVKFINSRRQRGEGDVL